MATDMGAKTESAPVVPTVQVDGPAQGRGRRWLVPLVAAVAVAGVAIWALFSDGEPTATTTDTFVPSLADVVRTDLVEQSSFEGTLGRTSGDAIVSRLSGTVTSVPEPGATVASGDLLFEVDGEPVVLVEGTVPAWRDLGLDSTAEAYPGQVAGTVTSTIEEGTVVEQGDVLYSVDNEPVVVMYGDTPAFRTMREDDEGPDVLQLEEALVALGYDPDLQMTVDGVFTSYTEALVESWQLDAGFDDDGVIDLGAVLFIPGPAVVTSVDVPVGQAVNPGQSVVTLATGEPMTGDDVAQLEAALAAAGHDADGSMVVDDTFTAETRLAVLDWQITIGADPDGIVHLGEVVFLPDAIRVSDNLVAAGGAVNGGGGVLAVTSQETVVTVDLPAEDQGLLSVGQAVVVELPAGSEVAGTVTSVATVATVSANNTTVFEVLVALDDPSAAAGLDEAPVDVLVVTDSVENVIAVPVTALVALAEGGYAVEVDSGSGTTRLVGVEPGFFADGLVEVSDTDLEPGDQVVVP